MSLSLAPSFAASIAAKAPTSAVSAAFRVYSISSGDLTCLNSSTNPEQLEQFALFNLLTTSS